MISLKIKGVVIYDPDGNYILHGDSAKPPEEIFKAMLPLWNFDPSTEGVKYVEFELEVPWLGSTN